MQKFFSRIHFRKMGLDEQMFVLAKSPLVAFDGTRVFPKGIVERTLPVNFLVIESKYAFNAIMGRGWIHAMHRVVSTLYQVMRCQSPDRRYTIDIHGDQSQTRMCYTICISDEASTSGTKKEEELQQSQNCLSAYLKKVEDEVDEPMKTIEKLLEVVLEEGEQKKIVWVDALLPEVERAKLVSFLKGNMDIFACLHKDMPGIAPKHAMHSLNIDPIFPPVRQNKGNLLQSVTKQ